MAHPDLEGWGICLRRHIGASVIRPLHLGWPTQQQRRAQEAVAVLGSQTIPWDRHRQIKGKFCTVVGAVVSPLLSVIYMNRWLAVHGQHRRRRSQLLRPKASTQDVRARYYKKDRGACPA